MKLFKLVKSIDYVTYPAYKELVKISNSVNNSITAFRDMLISATISALLNATPLSAGIISGLKKKCPEGILGTIANYEQTPLFLAIGMFLIIFTFINLIHFLISRFRNNKNTKEQRDMIVNEFYHVVIPQWVEVRSILEKIEEMDLHKSEDKMSSAVVPQNSNSKSQKKLLLLLQAKHEIFDLHLLLRNLGIKVETKGVVNKNSEILIDRIGRCAYDELITAVFEDLCEIQSKLEESYHQQAKTVIEEISAKIEESGPFNTVEGLKEKLEEKRKNLQK